MRKLSELIGKVEDITLGEMPLQYKGGDMFQYLEEFFLLDEVQEAMITYNQEQMFDFNSNRNGRRIGNYANETSEYKRHVGLPSVEFTLYESGSFYRSMGVVVGSEAVAIVSDIENALGLDTVNHWGTPAAIEMSHIYEMFESWDENRLVLGLTDDNFDTFASEGEQDLRGFVLRKLKNYLYE